MKKTTRLLSLTLAALLTLAPLTGCSQSKEGTIREGLYYDATGICPDATLLTVDGWPVPADRYLYGMVYNCDYAATYFGEDIDWDEEREGGSLGAYVKQTARDSAVLYAVIEAWAEQYGCVLTAEDQAQLDEEWSYYCNGYGGEAAYLELLSTMGADRALAQQSSVDYFLYSHLYDLFCTQGSKLCPEPEQLTAYQTEESFLSFDTILVSTDGIPAEDSVALAEKRARAEEILQQIRAAGDPAAAFADLAGRYSDDPDRIGYPEGRTLPAGSGEVEEVVLASAAALAENTCSDVVTGDAGLYLVLRKPLDEKAVGAAYFDRLVQTAAREAEVVESPAYAGLETAVFYQKLTELRAALPDGAAVTPEETAPAEQTGEAPGA
ncbi:MAG: peptidylprolyl isomerase [Oscillospiraceae bacterium]